MTPDREKVIKGLEQFKADFKPFCGNSSDWARVDDTLALLKEQEAVEPVKIPWLHSDGSISEKYRCGSCDLSIFPSYKFCPFCGRSVKWE